MWVNKGKLLERYSDTVDKDFVIVEGSTASFDFLDADKTPFGRAIFAPVLYVFKAHKSSPLGINTSSPNSVHIYPVKSKRRGRMPADVYRDRKAHDLATFLLLPYVPGEGDFGPRWKNVFSSDDAFAVEDSSERTGASLIYLPHGINVSDGISKFSYVPPPQVLNHVFSWLHSGCEIYSHSRTFDQRLEGKIDIPIETVREISPKLIKLLEKRFKTKMLFKSLRNPPMY